LLAPLKRLDAWIASTADKVVVISENMRKIYTVKRCIPDKHIVTIPTWQDERAFNDPRDKQTSRRRYGLPENLFTFLFLGNIGPVAGVNTLVSAFAQTDLPDAQLVIVGDGVAKSESVSLVNKLNLSNVHFISDTDSTNVPLLQSMADVCLLPMKRGTGMSSIPSKLPSYLFSAKPVIATVDRDSDTSTFIHESGCGWVGDAEDIDWLADKMSEVAKLPAQQLDEIGQRGKQFALSHFARSRGVGMLVRTLSEVGIGAME